MLLCVAEKNRSDKKALGWAGLRRNPFFRGFKKCWAGQRRILFWPALKELRAEATEAEAEEDLEELFNNSM